MTLQEALRALTPNEKLAVVTQLWDELAASAPLTLPDDELAEMNRRRDELLANPDIAIDADEVWRRVRWRLNVTIRSLPLTFANACSYYDSITDALGNRFRANVRLAIQTVVERPESYGRIGGEFRGALVDRFPYVVVFTIDDSIPTIFGLRHAASDRSDWFGRTMPDQSGESGKERHR